LSASDWRLVGMPDGVKVNIVRLPGHAPKPSDAVRRQVIRSHGFMPSYRNRMRVLAGT
jgi:hypothetical protein